MSKDRQQWYLTFIAADDDQPPVEQRVRRLLKAALRGYRLRCVSVGPPPADTESAVGSADGSGGCDGK